MKFLGKIRLTGMLFPRKLVKNVDRRKDKQFLASGLALIILILFLTSDARTENKPFTQLKETGSREVETSSYQKIPINLIWENPTKFVGQKILVEGTYLGWKGKVENPLITRSDWAIQDATGAIYATGAPVKKLNPMRDIGQPLSVWGIVRVNPKGVPYIAVEKAMVGPKK
ncbi:MAG: hypothetical protein PHU44_02500 [Syntrophales bacterium]|nr:hypothetical protein [Syntrophales bacterium]MDD5641225.1 hypothetical protein [Syntrophales bacterium]